jgi:non-homologous end joining protein Ku
MKLVHRRARNAKAAPPVPRREEEPRVLDLMAALRKSVGERSNSGHTNGRRPRAKPRARPRAKPRAVHRRTRTA